jgi:uncharacterized protein YidB (DUF937 family)
MDIMNLTQQFITGIFSQTPGMNKGIFSVVLKLVQYYPGGLSALVKNLEESGLKEQVQSWVSTGANKPINSEQIQQAMGNHVQNLAKEAGMPQNDAAAGLAALLPQVIDKLTPQGNVPSNNDEIVKALDALRAKLAA